MNARILAVFFVLTASIFAQYSVLRSDGTRVVGAFVGVGTDSSISIREGGTVVRVDRDAIVALEGDASPSPLPSGMLRFDLRDRSRVIGRLMKGGDESLEVVGLCTGALRFALDDVAVVWNLAWPHVDSNLGGDPKKDGLYVALENGLDALPGALISLAADSVVFSSAAGAKRPFAWNKDRVAAVRIVGAGDRAFASAKVTLELRDGSRLLGDLIPSTGPILHMKLLGGGEAMVEPAGLRVAMFSGGKFRHLSDLPFTTSDRPFLPTLIAREVLKDRGLASGTWLKIGRSAYSKGLLIPAGVEVRVPIDGALTMRADVGADPSTAGRAVSGGLKFVFLLGDRVLAESKEFRPGDEPLSMQIDGFKGGKELIIRVVPTSPTSSALRAVLGNAWLLP